MCARSASALVIILLDVPYEVVPVALHDPEAWRARRLQERGRSSCRKAGPLEMARDASKEVRARTRPLYARSTSSWRKWVEQEMQGS